MSSEDTNQNTTTSKWKDPEFIRAYQRERYKKKNAGYKLHPYIMEDGRRWRDVHEFPPEFESKEAWEQYKKDRNKSYTRSPVEVIYVPKPKIKCDVCDIEIKHGKFEGHLKSVKHKHLVSLLEKHGITST